MDKIWRLMTAMFTIIAACGLFTIAYVITGGMFNDFFSVIVAYFCLFGVPIGIAKGLLVIIDYHREHKDEAEE